MRWRDIIQTDKQNLQWAGLLKRLHNTVCCVKNSSSVEQANLPPTMLIPRLSPGFLTSWTLCGVSQVDDDARRWSLAVVTVVCWGDCLLVDAGSSSGDMFSGVSGTCANESTVSDQRFLTGELFTRHIKRSTAIANSRKPISELRSVTCHMGSHSVTCHPTQVNAPALTQAR